MPAVCSSSHGRRATLSLTPSVTPRIARACGTCSICTSLYYTSARHACPGHPGMTLGMGSEEENLVDAISAPLIVPGRGPLHIILGNSEHHSARCAEHITRCPSPMPGVLLKSFVLRDMIKDAIFDVKELLLLPGSRFAHSWPETTTTFKKIDFLTTRVNYLIDLIGQLSLNYRRSQYQHCKFWPGFSFFSLYCCLALLNSRGM
jgi:hypothetical protein